MRYSYNLDKKDVVFAGAEELNASYKDLAAVCDFIRYKKVDTALAMLDAVINGAAPIEYRKFNKGMGARSELHGRKGRYPSKAASLVKKVVLNAYANASGKGYMPEEMYIVHASANKGEINRRYPSKGVRTVMRGGYGYATMRRSDLVFAKVEIGLSNDYGSKSRRLSRIFSAVKMQGEKAAKRSSAAAKAGAKRKPEKNAQQPSKKPLEAPKPASSAASTAKKDGSAEAHASASQQKPAQAQPG
ncbi:MAG: 50S ribosomal protein L22 [Candidatus Micrarchaeia archaeon]